MAGCMTEGVGRVRKEITGEERRKSLSLLRTDNSGKTGIIRAPITIPLNIYQIIYWCMVEDLTILLVAILFAVFILIVPWFLYTGLRRIMSPVSLRLPVFLAGAVLLAIGGILQFHVFLSPNSMAGTLLWFFLFLLLTVLAVITPYFHFGEKGAAGRPWLVFSLLSFIGCFLIFWTTLGESREGGPLPLFTPLLPLTGWILDLSASLLNIGDIVYSADLPVHTTLLAAGLYLEVFIMAALFYALTKKIAAEKRR